MLKFLYKHNQHRFRSKMLTFNCRLFCVFHIFFLQNFIYLFSTSFNIYNPFSASLKNITNILETNNRLPNVLVVIFKELFIETTYGFTLNIYDHGKKLLFAMLVEIYQI